MPSPLRTAVACLVGALAAASSPAAQAPNALKHDLDRDGAFEVDTLGIDAVVTITVTGGGRSLVIEVTPDGKVTFLKGDGDRAVSVRGTDGDSVAFSPAAADVVAVWPVRSVSIAKSASGIFANLGASEWAFVVRAERAAKGLKLQVGGAEVLLAAGERLDLDRDDGQTVFRQIAAAWPGIVLSTPAGSRARDVALGEEKTVDLSGDEGFSLDALSVAEPVVYTIRRGNSSIRLRVVPGGAVTFLGGTVAGSVAVKGSGGDVVRFRLGGSDQVTIWPLRQLNVSLGPTGFFADLGGADWTFAVRAEVTRKGGLRLTAGDDEAVLLAGQRLDLDREGSDAVFRRITQDWQRIALVDPATEGGDRRLASANGPAGAAYASFPGVLPTLPFFRTGWAAWEIVPATAVSP